MSPRILERSHGERGLTLVLVVVFTLVLTLTIFAASILGRTDLQIVNTIENSAEAFYFANAGTTEALVRLSMSAATPVTRDGCTFDARIEPDTSDAAWKARIADGCFTPSKSGSTFRTPTLQAAATALGYTTASPTDPEALEIAWVPDASEIDGIKRIDGSRALRVTAIGRSGQARRRVSVVAAGGNAPFDHVILGDVCKAVNVSGSGVVDFEGSFQVNSTCPDQAVSTSGGATLSAAAIDIVGGVACGGSGGCSPTPNVGVDPFPDPLASLPEPPMVCPTPAPPKLGNVWQPGTYCSGLTADSADLLAPGLYLLDGDFTVSGGKSLTTQPGGATLYLRNGKVTVSGSGSVDLQAPSSGPYAGILFFLSRTNTKPVTFSGGSNLNLDGVLYAPVSQMKVTGTAGLSMNLQMVVHRLEVSGNADVVDPTVGTPLGGGAGYEIAAWNNF